MKNTNNETSLGRAAIIAAISLLLMAIVAPIANFAILEGIVVQDDPGRTYNNLISFIHFKAMLSYQLDQATKKRNPPIRKESRLKTYISQRMGILGYRINEINGDIDSQLFNGCNFIHAFRQGIAQLNIS